MTFPMQMNERTEKSVQMSASPLLPGAHEKLPTTYSDFTINTLTHRYSPHCTSFPRQHLLV